MKVKTADMTKYRRDYMRQYRKDNPEKIAVLQRANYDKNIDARRAYGRARYAERWAGWLKYKYGITAEQYFAMLTAQGSKCAICSAAEPGGRFKNNRFHVDHCHATGVVRGLLCNACNHMLGCARDVPATLRAAAEYLELTEPKKSS